ncbi:tetratricopeptide repeat protein [Leptolyngbya sp. AN03gr2]|uniref:tetratricopeptide repeat protein n=1 Tax=unclassified Leptolyngbya TaxID=2650499 RepID=UPI003D31E012
MNKRCHWSAIVLTGFCSFSLSAHAAEPTPSRQPDRFSSPLELKTPDPLLPGGLTRPLSEPEKQTLRTALDQLNNEASTKLRSGDTIGAFNIWNRELRLRRALGLLEEVEALGRVGNIAWVQNQPIQVRFITNRLSAIQTQVQQPLKNNQVTLPERSQILPALGIAFQQVRSPGLALNVYQQMLAEARSRKDAVAEVDLLNTIGQLHLSWFDYPNAIATYTELLNLAKSRSDAASIELNLIQLAYVHEQAKQPAQAVPYQQQLIELYQRNPQQAPLIAPLKIRQADNLAAANQLEAAEKAYQEAFQLAQPLGQLAYASDALRKLGALYRSNNRLDAALQVYEYLASVQQQAYDSFGVMDAYDQIGQIQLQRNAFPEAANAFRQGLEVAKQFNYRVDYFTEQIQKIQASR